MGNPKPPLSDNATGALWILGAAFFGSGMSAVAKFTGARVGALEVSFFRAVIGLVLTLPFILRAGRRGWVSRQPLLQTLRGITASAIMLCGFYGIIHIPLADFTVISFTKVLFVVLFAALILGERIHRRRSIATAVGFVGVLIIARPTGDIEPAVLVALAGTLLIGINIVLVKVIGRTDATATMVLYSNLVQCLVLAAPAVYYWVTPGLDAWLGLIAVGVLGTVVQVCIVRGYTVAEAGAVIPFDYTRLLFAGALGYVFFGEMPDRWTWTGAGVIVMSTFYIARREARMGKKRAKAGLEFHVADARIHAKNPPESPTGS